jgi:hypothetical protein
MLMHTCCCIFIYVVSGFDRIQKGVQNLLKMNLQNYLIKENKILIFSPLPWFLVAGSTSPPPPLLSTGPSRRCPSFPSARPSWPARPSSWAGPQAKPARSRLLGPLMCGACPPQPLPRGAAASAVSYLPPGWPGAFPFLAPPEIELISPFPSRLTCPAAL